MFQLARILLFGSLLLVGLALLLAGRSPQPPVFPPVVAGALAATAVTPDTTQGALLQAALFHFGGEQLPEGCWPGSDRTDPAAYDKIETTALVLLAFHSAGQYHQTGTCRETVQRGFDYLAALPAQRATRSQALVTLALCSLFATTRDQRWESVAQQAVNHLAARQHDAAATTPRETIYWQMQALREAHSANLKVPAESLQPLADWFVAREKHSLDEAIDGGLLSGLRAFSRMPAEERMLLYDQLCVIPYGQQSLANKYFTAQCLHDFAYDKSAPALRRLQADVGDDFTLDESLADVALRVLILQTRPPRFVQPRRGVREDDFPL